MRQAIVIENLPGAAGTPKDIINKLNAEVVKALAEPDVRDKRNQQGVTPRGTSAAELGTLTKAQFEKCARLIKGAGIKADLPRRLICARHLHAIAAVAFCPIQRLVGTRHQLRQRGCC